MKTYGRKCDKCRGINQAYMVTDAIWKEAKFKPNQIICVFCLEKKIGRKLTLLDFTPTLINTGIFGFNCLNHIEKTKLTKQENDWISHVIEEGTKYFGVNRNENA